MMLNLGVSIDEKTFSKMKSADQRLALFRSIKTGNKIHDVIQYSWLTLITGYLGLFKIETFNLVRMLIGS